MLFFKFFLQLTADKFRKKTDRESVTSEQDAAAIAEAEDDDVFDEAKPAALEEKQDDAESGGMVYIK